MAQKFFSSYLQFDISEVFIDLMMNLPKDITDYWKVTGNWLQTVDLIYTDNPDHRFLKSREAPFIIEPLSTMDSLNIVTDWFEYDPGWRVDRSVQADSDHFVSP